MDKWNIQEAFVIKRPSFFYEAEVRAITCLPDHHISKKVFSKLDMERETKPISRQRSIDPNELTKQQDWEHIMIASQFLYHMLQSLIVFGNKQNYMKN